MTQEEKQLLLRDLCGRLPYGVKCQINCKNEPLILKDIFIDGAVGNKGQLGFGFCSYGRVFQELEDVKPFLRPMSSMTEEEEIEYDATFATIEINGHYDSTMTYKSFDFLNAHHLYYRGLIPMGLAIEAPGDMYQTTQEK